MALTTDQENQVDLAAALAIANAGVEVKRARLEAVRLAKETLIENARSKSVDARDVTAADITAFASALNAYIDA
jgi:hypothetical protein